MSWLRIAFVIVERLQPKYYEIVAGLVAATQDDLAAVHANVLVSKLAWIESRDVNGNTMYSLNHDIAHRFSKGCEQSSR